MLPGLIGRSIPTTTCSCAALSAVGMQPPIPALCTANTSKPFPAGKRTGQSF